MASRLPCSSHSPRSPPRTASSIKGASRSTRTVAIDELAPVDLVVTGCVAVDESGARLGKGGGYSDLELAIAAEAGLVDEDTIVVTTVHDLQGMLELAGARAWSPPIVETVATTDQGVDALVDAIGRHRASLAGSEELAQRREQRIADAIHALVLDQLIKQAHDFCSGSRFATVVRRVADGKSDPYTAATLLTEGGDGGEA